MPTGRVMAILALGVSHRTAPIELLERLAFDDDALQKAYRRVGDLEDLDEAVVLSTCNRVEVFGSVGTYHGGFLALKRLLTEGRDVDPDDVAGPLYAHWEEEAVEHLGAVAAGLDSMVLGEPQIQAQVREAHRRAREEGAAGQALAAVFHTALRAGRRVRDETAIGAAPDAFVAAGADLADGWLGGLEGRTAVVVGAGRMAALAVRHLRARGVGR
ncbi:MAG TPA: glutamyl-tRNA reductase, partial [Actinomycetota bacterium]|nr:glutamyl-tRNA reductase [Actinomycetota bacterium]